MKKLVLKVKVNLNSVRQFLNCQLHLKELRLHEKASEPQQKLGALCMHVTTEDLHTFPGTSHYFWLGLFGLFLGFFFCCFFFSAGLNICIYFTFCFSLK